MEILPLSGQVPPIYSAGLSPPDPSTDVPIPLPSSDPVLPPIGSPAPLRCSSCSRSVPDRFDPSTCLSVPGLSPTRHYCETLDVKRPTEGLSQSFGGSTKCTFLHKGTTREKAPKIPGERLERAYTAGLTWNRMVCTLNHGISSLKSHGIELAKETTVLSNGTQLINYLNPFLFATIANQEDNPTFTEAMNGPDAAGFQKAMEIEIEQLTKIKALSVICCRKDMNVISSVWAFNRKRYHIRSVIKLKARICARGFEQEHGVDYFETFAPVVQWMTVRIMLIFTILIGLENKQIDYQSAFIQCKLDDTVYVAMPKLFEKEGHVWELHRAIYGLKQSPRAYFLYSKHKLEQLGFSQSVYISNCDLS